MKKLKLSRFWTLNVLFWFTYVFNIVMIFQTIFFHDTRHSILEARSLFDLIYLHCWTTGPYYYIFILILIGFLFIFIIEIVIRIIMRIKLNHNFFVNKKLRITLYCFAVGLITAAFLFVYLWWYTDLYVNNMLD